MKACCPFRTYFHLMFGEFSDLKVQIWHCHKPVFQPGSSKLCTQTLELSHTSSYILAGSPHLESNAGARNIKPSSNQSGVAGCCCCPPFIYDVSCVTELKQESLMFPSGWFLLAHSFVNVHRLQLRQVATCVFRAG